MLTLFNQTKCYLSITILTSYNPLSAFFLMLFHKNPLDVLLAHLALNSDLVAEFEMVELFVSDDAERAVRALDDSLGTLFLVLR